MFSDPTGNEPIYEQYFRDENQVRQYYTQEQLRPSKPEVGQQVLIVPYDTQCVTYVKIRSEKKLGVKFKFNPNGGDAKDWITDVSNFEKGKDPRTNSIAVFNGTAKYPTGHVLFVEYWDPNLNKIYFSEANWNRSENGKILSMDYDIFIKRGGGLLGYVYTD